DGTLVNQAAVSASGAGQTGGVGDRALTLNGTNGSHMIVNNAEFGGYNPGPNSYSVAFWVKRNHATAQGGGLFDVNIENGGTKAFQADIGSTGNFNCLVGSTGAGGGGGTWGITQSRNGTISETAWHHIAAVIDGSNLAPAFRP